MHKAYTWLTNSIISYKSFLNGVLFEGYVQRYSKKKERKKMCKLCCLSLCGVSDISTDNIFFFNF